MNLAHNFSVPQSMTFCSCRSRNSLLIISFGCKNVNRSIRTDKFGRLFLYSDKVNPKSDRHGLTNSAGYIYSEKVRPSHYLLMNNMESKVNINHT